MSARLSLVLGLLVACGGEDGDDGAEAGPDSGTTPPGTTAGTELRSLVSAAAGGTVEAFGATLTIPAGALDEDTEITVTVGPPTGLPDSGTVVGQVFDLGPDGTTFDPPATLTLPASATPAADQSLVVSWLDGAAWTDLSSGVRAGTVSAEVAHFTSFAARLVTDPADPYGCAPVAGCGGDVTGDWQATSSCVMSAGEVPFACEVGFVTTFSGSVGGYAFAGDGTFLLTSTGTGTGEDEHVVPAECVPAGVSDCASLYDSVSFATATCSGDVAVACTCTSDPYPGPYTGSGVGSWTAAGTTLTLTVAAEQGYFDTLYEYCVSGDTLTTWDPQGIARAWTRQP